MNYQDIMMFNMFISNINKSDNDNQIVNMLYMILMISFLVNAFIPSIKNQFVYLFDTLIVKFNKKKSLTFLSIDKDTSKRFRAIMFYISKSTHPSLVKLSEIVDKYYVRNTDRLEESNQTIYRVEQNSTFNITSNIFGNINTMQNERRILNGNTSYELLTTLEIFSYNLSLIELQKWVDDRVIDHEKYLTDKLCDKQSLIEVSWNPKDKEVIVDNNIWSSNVTFENRFFTRKNEIIDKIKFFLNNPQWYKDRGIPYTLGFLLWGEPGCGKTGFIKALMNMTGRHGISIKLNKKFDMNKLKDIMYNDKINDDIIIPQNNRIIIFEDIDCMDSIVNERDDNEEKESNKEKENKSDINDLKKILESSIDNNNYNNNLSYFLNILDGLQECPGRIIIMTTNKPEQLDKALIRPGRIDLNINFTLATILDIKNILKHFYNINDIEINDSVHMKISHASVVNICRSNDNITDSIKMINNL